MPLIRFQDQPTLPGSYFPIKERVSPCLKTKAQEERERGTKGGPASGGHGAERREIKRGSSTHGAPADGSEKRWILGAGSFHPR